MTASDRRSLGDRDLAAQVVSGDATAWSEAERRFAPLFTHYAKVFCARLAHRTDRASACPGFGGAGCDGAFTWAYLELRKRLIGLDPRDASGKANRSELVRYLDHPRGPDEVSTEERTFAQHVSRCGMHGWQTDVLRAWNTARGLVVRPRSSRDTELFEPALRDFLEDDPHVQALREAGFEVPSEPMAWMDALYTDACQTGTTAPIDHLRAGRLLDGALARQQLMVQHLHTWEVVLETADRLILEHAPEYHDRTLGRAREQTRLTVSLDARPNEDGDEFDDPTWRRYDEIDDTAEPTWRLYDDAETGHGRGDPTGRDGTHRPLWDASDDGGRSVDAEVWHDDEGPYP